VIFLAPPLQGRGWGWGVSQSASLGETAEPHPNPSPEGEGLKYYIAASRVAIGMKAKATELSATPYGTNSLSPWRIAPQL